MTVQRLTGRLDRIEHAHRRRLAADMRTWTDAELHAALNEGARGFTAWLRSLYHDELRELIDRPDVAARHTTRFELR